MGLRLVGRRAGPAAPGPHDVGNLSTPEVLFGRKAVSLVLAGVGTCLFALGLADAITIPAIAARSRALDDYAGVGLVTFVSLVILLPLGFLLVSVAHHAWPEPGRARALVLGVCGVVLGLVEAGWIAVSLWNGAQVGPGILTSAASGAAVVLAAVLTIRVRDGGLYQRR